MNRAGLAVELSTTDYKNTINPIWNASTNPTGALKYIIRTETEYANNLSTVSSTGGQIGGNALTLTGTQGTYFGEAGYNTDTGLPMWPFPYEALYFTNINEFYHQDSTATVYGNRGGFATAKQLDTSKARTPTSYVWDYLGNPMPSDIYKSSTTITANATNVAIGSTVTFTASISSGTAPMNYFMFGDGTSYSTTSFTATHYYNLAGTYQASMRADTNVGSTNPGVLDVTVYGGSAGSTVTASCSANPTTVVLGNSILFTGSASTTEGSITTTLWDFKDGTTASGLGVLKTYASTGTYVVDFTATDSNGSVGHDHVTVNVIEVPVNAIKTRMRNFRYINRLRLY
jgi:hypothetical protein